MSEILTRWQDPTIKELKHKIKVNEKSRRKMQQSLMKEILQLTSQLQQKENIIKEAREKVNKALDVNSAYVDYEYGTELLRQELLAILDTGDDK